VFIVGHNRIRLSKVAALEIRSCVVFAHTNCCEVCKIKGVSPNMYICSEAWNIMNENSDIIYIGRLAQSNFTLGLIHGVLY